MNVPLLVTFAGVAGTVYALWLSNEKARPVYWTSSIVATSAFVWLVYPKPGEMVTVFILAVFLLVGSAYFNTPYIKIWGKIYAFNIADSDVEKPPLKPGEDRYLDSYGGMATATKAWWIFVPLSLILAGNIEFFFFMGKGSTPKTIMAAIALCIIASMIGFIDGSYNYPIARGQYIQFTLAGFVSLGAFTIFYVPAYFIGKRWPWRRSWSTEYRAHPRHWQD